MHVSRSRTRHTSTPPPSSGLRLVLISRTASRLEEEAKAITDKFGVEVRVIAADLTSTDPAVFSRIQESLRPLDVGILVNNAGMSYPHPEYMHIVGEEDIKNIVNLNVLSLSKVWARARAGECAGMARRAACRPPVLPATSLALPQTHPVPVSIHRSLTPVPSQLCRIVLGGMKERGRGLVVNVGSGAATAIPSGPLLAVYTASKVRSRAWLWPPSLAWPGMCIGRPVLPSTCLGRQLCSPFSTPDPRLMSTP